MRSESFVWLSFWIAVCPSRESIQLRKIFAAFGCAGLSSATKVKAAGSSAVPSFQPLVSIAFTASPCARASNISSPLPKRRMGKRFAATQSIAWRYSRERLRLVKRVGRRVADPRRVGDVLAGAALGHEAREEIAAFARHDLDFDFGKLFFEFLEVVVVVAQRVKGDLALFLRRGPGPLPLRLPALGRARRRGQQAEQQAKCEAGLPDRLHSPRYRHDAKAMPHSVAASERYGGM